MYLLSKNNTSGPVFAALENKMSQLQDRLSALAHLFGVRASFHNHRLRPPRMTMARALGHSGNRWPATTTSGRMISRISCAKDISPNITLATRNPKICAFMLSSSF
jgi:hypothetical protein